MLETLPEVFMPFYMLLPDDGVSGSARAILAIPAHGANKNTVCGIAETEEEAESGWSQNPWRIFVSQGHKSVPASTVLARIWRRRRKRWISA